MAVPIISFPQSAFPFKTSTSAKTAAASLRSSKDSTVLAIANTFDTLTASVHIIENLIRSCVVVDEAWFKVIGIGGTGYGNAPFRVDVNGVVALRTPDLVDVGWLGSKFDASKTVTGAVDNGGGLIRLTVAAHGYVSGNTIKVTDVGGVPNATGYWIITWVSATQFDLVGSTWGGLYTTGGSATRYYGGAWFQTLFVSGTSAATAKLVADAAGNLTITGALISLISGTKSIILDPATASITVADTATDIQAILTAGTLEFRKITASLPSVQIGYVPDVPGVLGLYMRNLSGATEYTSLYINTEGDVYRKSDANLADTWQVYGTPAWNELTFDRFRGTVETPLTTVTGDIIADINFRAGHGVGVLPDYAAQITVTAMTVTPTALDGSLVFLTSDVVGGLTERMGIYGKKVGIATTVPAAGVDVDCTLRVKGVDTAAAVTGIGLELFYSSRAQIRSYDRDTSAWTPLWIDSSNLILNHQVATHLVGVGTATPYCKLDVAGAIRTVSFVAPSAGAGAEINYDSSVGHFLTYDRSGSAFLETRVTGLPLVLNLSASSGNVLVKTSTNNTDGGVLQINGDCTPDVDQGGDLGTANVQWDDLRLKGTITQGTTVRLSAAGKGSFAGASISGLTSYANNAAAAGAGLAAGDLYTETGTDPLRVCVVY